MKLLDTTVAVDHLRGDQRAELLIELLVDEGERLLASEVTRFELLAGTRPRELRATESFMAALVWIPIDEEIARVAAGLAVEHREARGVGAVDYLIVATATVVGADLLTTNVRHFQMIPEIRPPYEP